MPNQLTRMWVSSVTTPAPEAPLVFPSVVFRPTHLLITCAALTALAIPLGVWAGHVMFAVFFGAGLGFGLINALLVQRSVAAITAEANPMKGKMAVNSAARLMFITTVGLTFAWFFRPEGLGVVFGLALFQVVLVLTTALPVWKKVRIGDAGHVAGAEFGPGVPDGRSAATANDMFKD
jgi:hypothetical protein